MTVHIGIPESERERVSNGLARLLADTYTLYLKTHNFHWNVTGPRFAQLHDLFETQYRELQGAVDEVAERIRALGFRAPGSYSEFAELSRVPEALETASADDMVRQLAEGHEQVARAVRDLIAPAQAAGDEGSVDLLVGRLRAHEKTAWMLRALLAEELPQRAA